MKNIGFLGMITECPVYVTMVTIHNSNRSGALSTALSGQRARSKVFFPIHGRRSIAYRSAPRGSGTDFNDTRGSVVVNSSKPELVCPICHRPLIADAYATGMSCMACNRTFTGGNNGIQDLTLVSGVSNRSFEKRGPNSVEIFKNPFVSGVYERGWRQSFSWAAFPGVDIEADMAMHVLEPVHGQVLVDMSCGSGLFTRKFLQSDKFSHIVAVDFSPTMLQETQQNFKAASIDPSLYSLVQADVARLPFRTGSIPGIHAGAAIHCWPDPLLAMAEMSRVLSPGGVFVGTTFLSFVAPLGEFFGSDDVFKPLRGAEPQTNDFRWWNEDELRDLCAAVGLENFTVVKRQFRFIMFSCSRPL